MTATLTFEVSRDVLRAPTTDGPKVVIYMNVKHNVNNTFVSFIGFSTDQFCIFWNISMQGARLLTVLKLSLLYGVIPRTSTNIRL